MPRQLIRRLAEVEKMYTVYVLYNQAHSKLYVGQTIDLVERLKLHSDHTFAKSYTVRFSGEWELIHREDFKTRKEALFRERQLKSYRGREWLKNMPR